MAVGAKVDESQALIAQHLAGIPNAHLYDGQTSIYDLARAAFGGTIALREHFRCVPHIIDFSNYLSYDGAIRPMRDPTTAARPHVSEVVVNGSLPAGRDGDVNVGEARLVAALVRAMTELPEYDGASIGAITLLADRQASFIQNEVLSLVDAVELQRRRFAAGNAAQFQGDERDVVLLSMVDSPRGSALPFRDVASMKQRYNVAASRARDQLWLVHSLDPGRDLQPGDLRRRLIEHVRDPGARRRAVEGAAARGESPFEREVIQHLVAAGYRVTPQVEVGHYRIDIVVSDDRGQVALECDGDRFHPTERIPDDLARQAVLERAGWRFVRLRGTRYFRDPDGAMQWVREELSRLGIAPVRNGVPAPAASGDGAALRERVLRRAWEIMAERGWVGAETTAPAVQSALGEEGAGR
jgi:very-short-patch-repair endonuclease